MNKNKDQKEKNYTIKDLGKGKYELNFTIPADVFEQSYNAYLKKQAEEINIKGFRKGKLPASAVEPALKSEAINETFARLAQTYIWYSLMQENLNPITPIKQEEMPKILIGTDITFSATVITVPKFKPVKAEKIKVKKGDSSVSDKEVDSMIENLFKSSAEEKSDKKTEEKSKKKKDEKKKEKPDDKWAEEVSKKYAIPDVKTLDDLKKILKKTLEEQKRGIIEKEYGVNILKEAIKLSKITVPEEGIEYEATEREKAFMENLNKTDKSLDDWLKEYNTTLEDIRKAWHDDSKVALEEHTFLSAYAEANEIEIDEKEFQDFITHVKQGREVQETPEWINSMKLSLIHISEPTRPY